jgi:hypothetical protein
VGPGNYVDNEHRFSGRFRPSDGFVNKGLELLHPIQNSLQLHPDLLSRIWNVVWHNHPIQDRRQGAHHQSPRFPSGAADNKTSRCLKFALSSFEQKKTQIGPVGMWESRRLFQAACENPFCLRIFSDAAFPSGQFNFSRFYTHRFC